MPASSGDPISAALNHSLAASSKFSCDEENLDTKLIGSAKRVLLSEIKYEQTSSYSSNLIDLKSKYIVLKPTGNVENNEFKLKNGLGLPKVKDNSNELKTSQGGSPKVSNVNNSSNSVAGSTSKSDSVLPSPKRVLFPPEKIQLGWQSKSQPVGSGMVNMGNTCYLNSTLQALFHVPAFVNWLLNDKAHKDKCENMNGLTQMENSCLICAVQKTLKNSMENSALNNAIRPHLVYSKLKLICKRLMHGHQEDAHEFLRYLIESMDRSYLKIMRASELDSYSKETSPLSQIFGGYLRTEVRCLECRNISVTFQHFQDMLLDIRQASAVNEDTALQKLTEITSLLQTMVECPVCLESVTPPARQCSNGHVTCTPCATKFPQCSVCRLPLLEAKPTLVNNLLEALPRLCPYSEEGCKEVCVSQLKEHERFCGYRPLSCREPGCNANISVCHMERHYGESHSGRVVFENITEIRNIRWKSFDINLNQIINTPCVFGKHFLYYNRIYSTHTNLVTSSFEIFFSSKPEHEYFVCVKFKGGKFEFTKTIKAISMEGENYRDGLGLVSTTAEDTDEFRMEVSRVSMQRITDNGGCVISFNLFQVA